MGPVSPRSSRAGWALRKEGGLSSMSPLVFTPFPRDNNVWSRTLLSAPIQWRGMEREGTYGSSELCCCPSQAGAQAGSTMQLPACPWIQRWERGAQRNSSGIRGPGSVPPPKLGWILGTKKPAFETRQNCPALCKAEAAGSTN